MTEKRKIPVAWDALEDAFENNAPEVHSFLHLENGDVTRIVDGVAEPGMRTRVSRDPLQLRVNAVSSREQYRWMERFIETVDEGIVHDELAASIDGKGAFRRFKDVLIAHPIERERWFTFRSERLRACMEAWLSAHDLEAIPRPDWPVPSADEVVPREEEGAVPRAVIIEERRARVRSLVELLPVRELDAAEAYLDFLRTRRRPPRSSARAASLSAESDESANSVGSVGSEEE